MNQLGQVAILSAGARNQNARLGVHRLSQVDWSYLGAGELGQADALLTPIREALPRGADVGYAAEDFEVGYNARFMQLRYALAPHLVMPGSDHEWVVARDRPDLDPGQELDGFRVVLVAADGTALLRRPR